MAIFRDDGGGIAARVEVDRDGTRREGAAEHGPAALPDLHEQRLLATRCEERAAVRCKAHEAVPVIRHAEGAADLAGCRVQDMDRRRDGPAVVGVGRGHLLDGDRDEVAVRVEVDVAEVVVDVLEGANHFAGPQVPQRELLVVVDRDGAVAARAQQDPTELGLVRDEVAVEPVLDHREVQRIFGRMDERPIGLGEAARQRLERELHAEVGAAGFRLQPGQVGQEQRLGALDTARHHACAPRPRMRCPDFALHQVVEAHPQETGD